MITAGQHNALRRRTSLRVCVPLQTTLFHFISHNHGSQESLSLNVISTTLLKSLPFDPQKFTQSIIGNCIIETILQESLKKSTRCEGHCEKKLDTWGRYQGLKAVLLPVQKKAGRQLSLFSPTPWFVFQQAS